MQLITPDWPAPAHIKAYCTTRQGEAGEKDFRGFNLALHVGDDACQVLKNRQELPFSRHIQWLDQQHTSTVVRLDSVSSCIPVADASFSYTPGIACAVMTADCMPLLLTNRQGTFVAAIHAGWRGLADNIIEQTLRQSGQSPEEILVWLGPAIGQTYFTVGEEVKAFFADYPSAFGKGQETGKYQACLHSIAMQKLQRLGVSQIYRYSGCTYANKEQFYSYRRAVHNGYTNTGRMLSYILQL